jgi:hypothetical protein
MTDAQEHEKKTQMRSTHALHRGDGAGKISSKGSVIANFVDHGIASIPNPIGAFP